MQRILGLIGFFSICSTPFSGVSADDGQSIIYRNDAFKFRVSIPAGLRTRMISREDFLKDMTLNDSSGDDHGVEISLPGQGDRSIGIFAGAAYWLDGTPGNLLLRGCRPHEANTILDIPPGLAIAGHPSQSCRFRRPDGRIEVLVGMREGEWRGRLCRSDIPITDYVARLETDPEHYEEDIARFRATLKTVRVFLPRQKFTCTPHYRNKEFGFSVRMPPGKPTCTGEPYEHNSGVVVYLDHGANRCTGFKRRPYVNFNGSYDGVEAGGTRGWLAKISCKADPGKIGPPPAGLSFPAKDLAGCTVKRPNGWIDVELAGASPWVAKDWKGRPFIIYSAKLHTTPARLKRDIATFRVVLRSVRLFKPDGDMQRVE
jgi:hypothetical protein